MKGIIAKKIGMTQMFDKDGIIVPMTILKAGPCKVVQKKTIEKDGYNAVQLGFEEIKEKKVNNPLKGHMKKIGEYFRFLKEIRDFDKNEGEIIDVDIFKTGEKVKVTGMSKGKGFQGVMKRWGMAGGFDSHGSTSHRRVGSIGNRLTPQKVFKGKRMPGHMGFEKVSIRNLEVVFIDKDNNLIGVKGAVPGPNGGILIIRGE
ncbi:MAG: 50S ribosomal protein L3 [Caldisericia bacterium]